MKRIALLGSTGSIGQSTLRVVRNLPKELKIVALAAHSNYLLLAEQIQQFQPEMVSIHTSEGATYLKKQFPHLRVLVGEEGLEEIVSSEEVDFVVMAIVGMQALKPTLQAVQAGKAIGLASKEVLVAAGKYVSDLAKKQQVLFLPIDSEHSAIFQCLEGRKPEEIRRVILTASGGPFCHYSHKQLDAVTVEQALAHPTWNMGAKVTIDSSTLANKGLELIEARWFFDLPPEKIEVVIHPQSLIHSLVEFVDGSVIAQMSEPNMMFPIQYALTYPKRCQGALPPFDFLKPHQLTFFPPDLEKFPALRLAQKALQEGNSLPAYFNAANEVLVERFLKKEISWREISTFLEKLINKHQVVCAESLDAILSIDQIAREEAKII